MLTDLGFITQSIFGFDGGIESQVCWFTPETHLVMMTMIVNRRSGSQRGLPGPNAGGRYPILERGRKAAANKLEKEPMGPH